jgi:hypothetical protein
MFLIINKFDVANSLPVSGQEVSQTLTCGTTYTCIAGRAHGQPSITRHSSDGERRKPAAAARLLAQAAIACGPSVDILKAVWLFVGAALWFALMGQTLAIWVLHVGVACGASIASTCMGLSLA